MSKSFSLLEKVSGIRQILTVVKSVQERKPDESTAHVLEVVEVAIYVKLSRLQAKPLSALSANQVASLEALRVAKAVLPDVLDLLGDEETTRQLDADERSALQTLADDRKAKREASAAKRKAAKAPEPESEDMFAEA